MLPTCTPAAPDTIQRAALEQSLFDARKAYHNLMTGISPKVVVDQNGERVEFHAANAGRLNTYILTLQSQLGVCGGAAMMPGAPAKFFF